MDRSATQTVNMGLYIQKYHKIANQNRAKFSTANHNREQSISANQTRELADASSDAKFLTNHREEK